MALTPVADALATILADARPLKDVERAGLSEALGRWVAEDITATIDVPPLANSAMDGYALNSAGLQPGSRLPVTQRIAAGSVGETLQAGSAARIFTGAPLPPGADCVVMQEDCERQDDWIELKTAPEAGDHVRPAGQDIHDGQRIIQRGQSLGPAQLGLLAAIGLAEVPVYRRCRVALLSTGDELAEPGTALRQGHIYNSNRPLLFALLTRLGCEVLDGGRVADTAEETSAALQWAAEQADCVITTGGVSAGEEDHVRAVLEREGELQLWQLAMKPGKPLAYGRMRGTPLLGLPGNPASAFVTFCVMARPYLLRMMGAAEVGPEVWAARAAFDWPRPGRRQEYLRVRLQADGDAGLVAELYPNQSSGVLASVAWCNALAIIPPETVLKKGEALKVLPLAELGAL